MVKIRFLPLISYILIHSSTGCSFNIVFFLNFDTKTATIQQEESIIIERGTSPWPLMSIGHSVGQSVDRSPVGKSVCWTDIKAGRC